MPSSIDHIVIISDDLDTAIANAEAAGFTVVPGGTHGDGNTHNALIGFADGSYIELIAPTAQGKTAEHRWFARLRKGGGLVDYCLLGTNLAEEIAGVRQRGIDYPEPFAMERTTPDGTTLKWTLTTPPGDVGEKGWPFMIEDITPRNLRVPQEKEQVTHVNGATGVAGLTVLVSDVAQTSREYEAILGASSQELRSPMDDQVFGSMLPLGQQWILLTEPGSHDSKDHLERFGQGPYRITLRSHDGPISPGTGSPIDAALFSGARIVIS